MFPVIPFGDKNSIVVKPGGSLRVDKKPSETPLAVAAAIVTREFFIYFPHTLDLWFLIDGIVLQDTESVYPQIPYP